MSNVAETAPATRDDVRNAVHRGVMTTYPMSVMEAVGYTQGGYDALLDGIADEVLTVLPGLIREQIARDIEAQRPEVGQGARIARGGAA